MRRADTACGEDIGVSASKGINSGDDLGFHIRDNTRFADLHPDIVQLL
jgi:hypothetical protein